MSGTARHLYLHVPFCAHRCGYCDFVTAVGRRDDHGPFVEALLTELELERGTLAPDLDTIFLGGGTPTFTEPAALKRLLAALPPAREVTVEANPETVTPELAALLREGGINRVSLGAQTFQPRLLEVLDRTATPDDVRHAVRVLRDAGFDNISLDLIYGIPGQSRDDLLDDLAQALMLVPEHLSAYELEAKPGTRFTHAHGKELERQHESMETYFEIVVSTLTGAGFRWYETANFCRSPEQDGARARDLRAHHNLGYWQVRDYLGVGIGAVSTIDGRRWRNAPSLAGYVRALAGGERPPREVEELSNEMRDTERVMLGLRLDEPIPTDEIERIVDVAELHRLEERGLVARDAAGISLTARGRSIGDAVTASLLA